MKDPHRQIGLRHGNTERVVNLPDHPKLKPGNRVTLKDSDDPDKLWYIVWVSEHTRPKSQLNRTWNNNI